MQWRGGSHDRGDDDDLLRMRMRRRRVLLGWRRRALAEAIGTAGLLCAIVGSGVMAERLASGNAAVALLANTIATASALAALIAALGPISGAHLNPWVSVLAWRWRQLESRALAAYVVAQLAGAVAGVLLAHLMFDLPLIEVSGHARAGFSQAVAEGVATFGLLLVVGTVGVRQPSAAPAIVACYIASAYWFTSSTSFANPAVTIARSLTDTFTGIRPVDVPHFLAGQAAGVLAAVVALPLLTPAAAQET
jgi:glycerol uptake facilitator-like aquaporin